MEQEDVKRWAAERFGIPIEDIVWYNNGICYDRIIVKTEESAKKVREEVKMLTVNGGMLDGMPLGGISEAPQEDGEIYYDVMC